MKNQIVYTNFTEQWKKGLCLMLPNSLLPLINYHFSTLIFSGILGVSVSLNFLSFSPNGTWQSLSCLELCIDRTMKSFSLLSTEAGNLGKGIKREKEQILTRENILLCYMSKFYSRQCPGYGHSWNSPQFFTFYLLLFNIPSAVGAYE